MTTILALPDEVMEDIFLRLDAAVDLVRASAVCPSHRSVICNRGFLRRYRLAHPPPVVGLLESMGTGGILHAEPPHESAPAASSLLQAADFKLSFLPVEPDSFPWRICDARDGRVLLSRRSTNADAAFLDLLICDPLYRRYLQIPSIPEDLWPKRYSAEMRSEPFLLPAAREEEDESRFRVIYNWVSSYKIISFLFDSASTDENSKWSVATTYSLLPYRLIHDPKILVHHRNYVGSCFYWMHHNVPKFMLVFDTVGMNFFITGLPQGKRIEWGLKKRAVVDAGVNRLGMAVLGPARTLDLYSRSWQNNGGSIEEWQHDKRHQLPKGCTEYYISGAAEGCLLLLGHRIMETVQYFKLDLKTFQIERFCESRDALYQSVPYARFPPSLLSPPSI